MMLPIPRRYAESCATLVIGFHAASLYFSALPAMLRCSFTPPPAAPARFYADRLLVDEAPLAKRKRVYRRLT